MEKPHTGLDDCLRMLQSCFRKKMSGHISNLELGAVGRELDPGDIDEDVLPGQLLGDVAPAQRKVQVGGLEVREVEVRV